MCGITGLYALNTQQSRSALHVIGKGMRDTLAHRGPDDGDVWQDPDMPLVLGHRRLSILDLSADGAQPMHSPCGRYVLVFNGEIYNHPALRKALEGKNIAFKGRSDTETLLAAIMQWGLNTALQKINGMFAFMLWDRKERVLHGARDRFGKKPLYIGWAGDALVFGSELKALCAHPDFSRDINRQSLALYMRYGAMQAPHCMYQGVWMVPPGMRFSLDLEGLQSGRDLSQDMIAYWDVARVLADSRTHPASGDEAQILQDFEQILSRCVKDRLLSDVPLGAFLSGGIDSSAIVALMQAQTNRPVKTYTIGFDEAGFDEAVYAKNIAAHLGTDHHELYVRAGDALDVIPRLPQIYDEPFADISAIPTYLVSRFAKDSVSVALSGDGGDEMLGGYARHIEGPKIRRMSRVMPRFMRRSAAQWVRNIPTSVLDRLHPAHPQWGARAHKAAAMLAHDTQAAMYESLIQSWDDHPVLEEDAPKVERPVVAGLSFAETMMAWDTGHYLPDHVLTKVDRASMAVSLEARAPLLDRRVFEYVWSLPEHYKIRDGKGKYLLRKLLNRYVPNCLFDRPKQGFNSPVGDWLRGDLRDWAENLLDEKTLREDGFLDAAQIRTMWDSHLNGRGNHAGPLWTALMFQAWHQRWR
ncbi:MAG: asparagine synthase (glutamine-hydrolyzing) [Bdellovibrionales bacterium]